MTWAELANADTACYTCAQFIGIIDRSRRKPGILRQKLARLLIDIYGVGYAGHPRLEKLLEINKIKPRDFMTGSQEADAFEQQNFVGLHQSTLRKVDIIANILSRAQDRKSEN